MSELQCPICQATFVGHSSRAVYCSNRCRMRASRSGGSRPTAQIIVMPLPKLPPTPADPDRQPVSVLGATLVELHEAGVQFTAAGRTAIVLATRIDDGAESDAGLSSLARALSLAIGEALRQKPVSVDDPLSRLRAKYAARGDLIQ